jgi:hypothetical protein
MTLRSDTFEAIDHSGLGYPEREPSRHLALQCNVELVSALSLLRCDILLVLTLDLKRELADQRQVFAASAPQGDVAFGQNLSAEIQLAKREEHLLNNDFIHQSRSNSSMPKREVDGPAFRSALVAPV